MCAYKPSSQNKEELFTTITILIFVTSYKVEAGTIYIYSHSVFILLQEQLHFVEDLYLVVKLNIYS